LMEKNAEILLARSALIPYPATRSRRTPRG
jgi:hypothetical protein